MSYIVYWTFLAIWLLIALFHIVTKRFSLIEFIICLTLLGIDEIVDNILAYQFHLYYYVDLQNTIFYSTLYAIFVYPASGIAYSRLFPKKSTIINLGLYSLVWVAFYTSMELFITERFHVIVYTGWKVIPYSFLFYLVGLPLFTWYYKVISSKFEQRTLSLK